MYMEWMKITISCFVLLTSAFYTVWNIKVIEDEFFLMFVLTSITKTKEQYYIMLVILCYFSPHFSYLQNY